MDRSTSLPIVATKPGAGIDYELFLDCVHCGLCTAACPTYVELGTEMDSPRGRIYLMRGVVDGRVPLDEEVIRHLDLCLDCRSCESACPSGVQYGKLIEPFRIDLRRQGLGDLHQLSWWQRLALLHVFPYAWRARAAVFPARLMQSLKFDRLLEGSGLLRLLPRRVRSTYAMLPRLPFWRHPLPETLPAEGKRRARVALFTGCVADALFHETNWITARVLQINGCEVWTPPKQVCCGALHFHAGFDEPALAFARANLEVFGRGSVDAIVTNVAGCGAMLKEYGHRFGPGPYAVAAGEFARKVKDVSEFLVELGPVKPRHPLRLRATYHDACHLCHAQQIRKQPRQLLEMIPELELVPLEESEICCGAAGSYNLAQPEMAERLGERKVDCLLRTKPQAVFVANAGCILQIAKHLKPHDPTIWVGHPIEGLFASYLGSAAPGQT